MFRFLFVAWIVNRWKDLRKKPNYRLREICKSIQFWSKKKKKAKRQHLTNNATRNIANQLTKYCNNNNNWKQTCYRQLQKNKKNNPTTEKKKDSNQRSVVATRILIKSLTLKWFLRFLHIFVEKKNQLQAWLLFCVLPIKAVKAGRLAIATYTRSSHDWLFVRKSFKVRGSVPKTKRHQLQ